MDKRLKVYSDKSWLPEGRKYVIMLYPFWGDIPLPADDPDFGRFDKYLQSGKEIFELVSDLSACDIVVLPFEYAFDEESKSFAQKANNAAKEKGKKLFVFYNSDDQTPINPDNSIILRTSFLSSARKRNEFAYMAWSADFAANGIKIIEKAESPEISYCGYVDFLKMSELGLGERLNYYFKKPGSDSLKQGAYVRGKAVRALKKDKRVNCNFLIRQGFWAEGLSDKKEARRQYVTNMLGSPYALVTRGAGNFSYRMYEVMSSGRIPVFINTDCVLPFDHIINWKKHCLWIELAEAGQIAQKLSEFHKNISVNSFTEMQKENRKLYEEYLSPIGFFKNIYRLLN